MAPKSTQVVDAPRVLLKDRALGELKRLIQTGAFPPGAFLSERRLADQLGMSKTPIRSALEQLEGLGLVAVSPQQGILVRELSLPETVELFELRLAVEPFVAGRLAARRLTPDQARRLADNLAAQEAAAAAGDALRAAELDVEFHLLLAGAFGNREIVRLLSRAFDKLFRTILVISKAGAGRLAGSFLEHAGIAKAVRGGRADTAARRMDDHLRYARQFLVAG
jgi:DNA-binding GntR family transcriptional regulator